MIPSTRPFFTNAAFSLSSDSYLDSDLGSHALLSTLPRSPTKLSHPTCCSFRFSPSMLHYQTNSSHTTVVCCPNLHRAHDIQPNFLDPLHLMIYTALFKPLDVGPDDRDITRHEHHHHFSHSLAFHSTCNNQSVFGFAIQFTLASCIFLHIPIRFSLAMYCDT